MDIRKTLIAVIIALGLLSPVVEANVLVAQGLAKLAAKTLGKNLGKAIAQETIKKSGKTMLSKITPYTAEIKDAFIHESTLLKVSFEGTKTGKFCKEIFESCIENPTMRKIVALKTVEYAVTMPGFILAAQGETQVLMGTTALLSQFGGYGIVLNAALLSGAASYYAFQFGLNQYEKMKQSVQKRNVEQNDTMIWSS